MSTAQIEKMTARQAGRIIDDTRDSISKLKEQARLASHRFDKNLLYHQIETRQIIIAQLNKRFFNN